MRQKILRTLARCENNQTFKHHHREKHVRWMKKCSNFFHDECRATLDRPDSSVKSWALYRNNQHDLEGNGLESNILS